MLIDTITFEIHDIKNERHEQFLVMNTIENQEMILTHRHTREIKFTKHFSFQFEKEMNMPIEFISMDTWARIVSANPELTEMMMH